MTELSDRVRKEEGFANSKKDWWQKLLWGWVGFTSLIGTISIIRFIFNLFV